MIISVRGANASGKTSLLNEFRAQFEPETPFLGVHPMRLPWFYELPGRMIVTRRGETIPIATLFDLIPKFDRSGYHVIYEHIFARSKAWQQLSIELDITWAVLDTPFEICLERMRARRKSGEVNEEVMRKGYAQYGREHVRAERAGVNVVPLRHDNALDDLNELAYAGGWEP